MESMVDVVVAKYMRPEQATEFMEYLLRLALYDLEEVWADECAGLRSRLVRMIEEREREQKSTTLSDSLLVQIDALEAENIRLKAQMQAQEAGIKQAKTRDDLLRLYNTEAP